MKKIITLFLIVVSFVSHSQTKLDTLIFNKVNEYRKSQNILPVRWDTSCYKASRKHTNFLYSKNLAVWPNSFSGHSEDTLFQPKDRFSFYSNNRRFTHLGEVSLAVSKNFNSNDTLILEKIAISVVDGWKSSPKHNKILLGDFDFTGIDCSYFTKSTNMKGSVHYRIVSTMLFVKY